jgi:hypothetical protein
MGQSKKWAIRAGMFEEAGAGGGAIVIAARKPAVPHPMLEISTLTNRSRMHHLHQPVTAMGRTVHFCFF